VVTITVTCYLWAPSGGDYLFTCGAIFPPSQLLRREEIPSKLVRPCFQNAPWKIDEASPSG